MGNRLESNVTPANQPSAPERTETVVAERRASETRPPRRYRVLLHNDDFTTMEFVVWVLEALFGHDEATATRLMLQVHHSGMAVAGVYPRAVAETKVAEVTAAAERAGMPLKATSEPEPDGA